MQDKNNKLNSVIFCIPTQNYDAKVRRLFQHYPLLMAEAQNEIPYFIKNNNLTFAEKKNIRFMNHFGQT